MDDHRNDWLLAEELRQRSIRDRDLFARAADVVERLLGVLAEVRDSPPHTGVGS